MCWWTSVIRVGCKGQVCKLPYVLRFFILAIVTGCNSYRNIVTFIVVHHRRLNAAFGLNWPRATPRTVIRYILRGLDPAAVQSATTAPLGSAHSHHKRPRPPPDGGFQAARGSLTRKRAPSTRPLSSRRFSALMRPFSASTICRLIDRPRPECWPNRSPCGRSE